MLTVIKIDSAILGEERNIPVEVNVPGIYNFQVCRGGGGWPASCEVGIYLDADNRRCCIIDWPRPCKPIKFQCEYEDFLVHLDTATEEEILSATEVKAEFFRDE
jgi:hypothetical protein